MAKVCCTVVLVGCMGAAVEFGLAELVAYQCCSDLSDTNYTLYYMNDQKRHSTFSESLSRNNASKTSL